MRKHTPFERVEPRKDREADKKREEHKKKLLAYIKKKMRVERRPPSRRKAAAASRRQEQESSSYPELRENIAALPNVDEDIRYERMVGLGTEFLNAAERGNSDKLLAFIEEDFPATYQDPMTGETALHVVAACQARKALRVLLKSKNCDFLLRDNQGRLASEMAYLYGRDPAVARLLGIKEREQATAKGIKLKRRPQSE